MKRKEYKKPTIEIIVVDEEIVLNSGELDFNDLQGDPE